MSSGVLRKRAFEALYPLLCSKAQEIAGVCVNVPAVIAYVEIKNRFEVHAAVRERLAEGTADRLDLSLLLQDTEHVEVLTEEQLNQLRPIGRKVARVFGPFPIEEEERKSTSASEASEESALPK